MAVGVGKPEDSLPLVVTTDACSWQITRADIKAEFFQIKRYSVEPFQSVFARNLLTNDRCRVKLPQETMELRPEMPFVEFTKSVTGARKRLTGTASGVDGLVVGPSSEFEGERPSTNSGKPMTLGIFSDFICFDLGYAAFVHVARGNESLADQFAEPRSHGWIEFVVVVTHRRSVR